MNKQVAHPSSGEAKNLVYQTFEKSFDESQFTFFIKNLLNNIDESKRKDYRGNIIPDSFDDNIRQYKRIGQYKDPTNNVIDVLVVELKRETSIERARTLQRNFVARHLKKRNHEAALVAYFTKGFPDWRFSFVKLEYNLQKKDDGRVKIEEDLSPAKRYSFLVGANERSHTAQSQFQKILTEIPSPTLAELEQAFNIETVTKEFFDQYRNLFIRTKQELDKVILNDSRLKTEFDSKDVNSVDFSKKLLGQIIFLYFLQKKGWFGVPRDAKWGEGSKHFLRELFQKKHRDYNDFFNEILEPLFYEALRVGEDRKHLDYYYSQFNCRIPFLNGGLFDPIGNYDWVHTDIILPNELFSNKHKTKEGDEGDGILDIFDRYNFTVIEDEPLEKEVAIDPELLGKAYEKFNAIRPDNFDEYVKALNSGKKGEENKFNKQYGVYYTPREIVHYMCRESLINYLASEFDPQTDSYEKLGDSQLDILGNTLKKGQLDLVTENISTPRIPKKDIETLINYGELFGENEAVVEFKGKETKTYHHKVPESIRKNAKLIDEKLADILICDPAVGSGAFPVGMMHEIVSTRNLLTTFIKDKTRTIYHFKRECIEKSLYGVDIDSGAVEIAKLRLWLSLVVDEDDFKEIKPLPNLDYKIVKGNSLLGFPDGIVKNVAIEKDIESLKLKYFSITDVNEKRKLKADIESSFSKLIEEAKHFSDKVIDVSFDFEVYFSEVFHKKKGFDIAIANPPYVVTKKGTYDRFSWEGDLYTMFFELSIKQLLRKKGTLSFITPRFFLFNQGNYEMRRYLLTELNILSMTECNPFEAVTENEITILTKEKSTSNEISFYIHSDENISFLNIVNKNWVRANTYFEINPYLTEEVFSLLQKIKNDNKLLRQVSSSKRGAEIGKTELRESNKGKTILLGYDVDKYFISPTNAKIETSHDEYHRLRKIFQQSKILFLRRVSKDLISAVPNYSFAFSKNLYGIIPNENFDEHFFCALLNSKLLNFYYKNKFSTKKEEVFPEIQTYLYEQLPIKNISLEFQNPFIEISNSIHLANQQNPQATTKHLEDQIDIMVYKLYNLTYEEMKIIDPDIEQIISTEEYEKFIIN